MRLVFIGRNLTVTIPVAITRELGLVARTHVVVERGPDRTIILTPLEEEHHVRGAYTARAAHANP